MLRLPVLQIARCGNNCAINVKIREERYSTESTVNKTEVNLTSIEATKARKDPIVQDSFHYATKSFINNVNKKDMIVLKMNKNFELQSKRDELNTVPSVKIVKSFKSFPILGDKATDSYFVEYDESDTIIKIPSVTRILNQTMSERAKEALERWKHNLINQYGQEYFESFCKGLLLEGRNFHKYIQDLLLKKDASNDPLFKPLYYSVKSVLENLQTVHMIESYVTHPTLRYRGVVDCVASYRDQLYVIDWKKSQKTKYTLAATFDAPVQVAAYIGAINASPENEYKIKKGLIVVAYMSGQPANVHELSGENLEKSWKEWLRRLEKFYMDINDKK